MANQAPVFPLTEAQLLIMTAVRDQMVKNRENPNLEMATYICTNIKRVVYEANGTEVPKKIKDKDKASADAKKLVADLQNAVMSALTPHLTYAPWRVANDKQIAVRRKSTSMNAKEYLELMRDGRIQWLHQIVESGMISVPKLI